MKRKTRKIEQKWGILTGQSTIAGIPMQKVAGSNTSVFTAAFSKDYHELHIKDPESLTSNFTGGVGTATLSNRISYSLTCKDRVSH